MRETIEPMQSPPPIPSRRANILLAIALVVAAVMVGLVIAHTPGVNGPWYWRWAWRRLSFRIYPLMALAVIPFFVAQWAFHQHGRVRSGIVLLMLATFCLELAAISPQRLGLARIAAIVENSVNTSYYTAANVLVEQEAQGVPLADWLSLYPDLMPRMQVHAKYKPPGLVLYYVAIIGVFGNGFGGQLAGGLILGAGATFAVLGTYGVIRLLGRDAQAAWCGASYMALCPSLILFFPQFDQVYPAIACAMILCWCLALERKKVSLAIAFGAVLTQATFMSYVLLAMGLFLSVYTILYLGRAYGKSSVERLEGASERPPAKTPPVARAIAEKSPENPDRSKGGAITRVANYAAAAIGVMVLLYGALWITTGFNPIETLRSANRLQEKDLIPLQRPFPGHIPWDFEDLALGTGWISIVLVGGLLVRMCPPLQQDPTTVSELMVVPPASWKFEKSPAAAIAGAKPDPALSLPPEKTPPARRLIGLSLLQLIVMGAAAFLPGETARLWLFMFPMLMVPIGFELSQWPVRHRMAVYAALWLVTAAIAQNMIFLNMGEGRQ